MPEIMDGTTIAVVFAAAVAAHPDRPFLAVPANQERGYLPAGFEITYGEAGRRIEELAAIYRRPGYGVGHRVATLLENRPEHVLHTLALNGLGVCCVPINPDYRPAEIAYLVDHSEPDLILCLTEQQPSIKQALAASVKPGTTDSPIPEVGESAVFRSGSPVYASAVAFVKGRILEVDLDGLDARDRKADLIALVKPAASRL